MSVDVFVFVCVLIVSFFSLVAHINTARLVSDLRQFISLARPEYGPVSFELMTTFPNKVIDNEAATIAASGLANASIVQRLTK